MGLREQGGLPALSSSIPSATDFGRRPDLKPTNTSFSVALPPGSSTLVGGGKGKGLMKTVLFVALLCLLPLLLAASPLGELARKERARRALAALARQGKNVRTYSDVDLQARAGGQSATVPVSSPAPSRTGEKRDRDAERLHWRKERDKLERELARLDAGIRRLESRLEAARARRRDRAEKNWDVRARDLQEEMIGDSLAALRAEREREVDRFLERGRREGALPGWLR